MIRTPLGSLLDLANPAWFAFDIQDIAAGLCKMAPYSSELDYPLAYRAAIGARCWDGRRSRKFDAIKDYNSSAPGARPHSEIVALSRARVLAAMDGPSYALLRHAHDAYLLGLSLPENRELASEIASTVGMTAIEERLRAAILNYFFPEPQVLPGDPAAEAMRVAVEREARREVLEIVESDFRRIEARERIEFGVDPKPLVADALPRNRWALKRDGRSRLSTGEIAHGMFIDAVRAANMPRTSYFKPPL